jgi:hypothetical protein
VHRRAVSSLGAEKTNGVVGHHDARAGPKHPRQRGARRKALLEPAELFSTLTWVTVSK